VGNDNPPLIYPKAGTPPTQIYWSGQMQQQISSSMIATIGYVGMHTYHLGVWSKPNQINATAATSEYGAAAAAAGLPLNQFLALPITDSRVAAAGIKNPWPGFTSIFGSGATAGQALRPYPQYGDVDNPLNPIGSVSYNGLQTILQKRFTQGLTFLLSYTFSKSIGNVDSNDGPTAGAEDAIYAGSFAQDYYNPHGERAVTSSDIPHVVSLSYTYELPLGHGKRFLNHGGAVNKVVGGWSVSGIQQYQSGRPIHIEYDALGASNPFFAAGDGYSFRPNIVPGQPLKNPAYRRSCSGPVQPTAGRNPCQFYINPAAFSFACSRRIWQCSELDLRTAHARLSRRGLVRLQAHHHFRESEPAVPGQLLQRAESHHILCRRKRADIYHQCGSPGLESCFTAKFEYRLRHHGGTAECSQDHPVRYEIGVLTSWLCSLQNSFLQRAWLCPCQRKRSRQK
jgi:hypothetical protein